MAFSDHVQYYKDRVKRFGIDAARRSGRLQTPMDTLLSTLKAYRKLPSKIHALEVFGMHGLWHTKDYAHLCETLEFYEINPTYALYASKGFPHSKIQVADSIRTVAKKELLRDEYNWIVLDNPFTCLFGDGYAEHFDLFPHILFYLKSGILILNFIHDITGLHEDHLDRRRIFYGKEGPTLSEALSFYKNILKEEKLLIEECFFIPRNSKVGYLAFVINKH